MFGILQGGTSAAPPTITRLDNTGGNPHTGDPGSPFCDHGGDTFTIIGTGFDPGMVVDFAGSDPGATWISSTQIDGVATSGSLGFGTLKVTNPDTQFATGVSYIEYVTC